MTSYVARDWNVRWTYECRHRIIESFRGDKSYSLCQVCSPLCPGSIPGCARSLLKSITLCEGVRDNGHLRDLNTFIDWFGSHDPFDGNVPQLRSVSSGLAASESDGIKCDETEKVVSEIQGSFDSVSVRNATVQETSDCAHPEFFVEAGVKV